MVGARPSSGPAPGAIGCCDGILAVMTGGSKSHSGAECVYVGKCLLVCCMCMLYAHVSVHMYVYCLVWCVCESILMCDACVCVCVHVCTAVCLCVRWGTLLVSSRSSACRSLLPRQNSAWTVSSPIAPYLHPSSRQAPGQGQEAEAASAG